MSSPSYLQGAAGRRAFIKLLAATPLFATMATQSVAKTVATAAGKAAFWDFVGAPSGSPKIVAFEGEFALASGHAQELKTQALALQVSAAPVSTPCATSAEPLNEISTVSSPNFSLNRMQVSFVVMVPAPQLSLPGDAFALATRSFAL